MIKLQLLIISTYFLCCYISLSGADDRNDTFFPLSKENFSIKFAMQYFEKKFVKHLIYFACPLDNKDSKELIRHVDKFMAEGFFTDIKVLNSYETLNFSIRYNDVLQKTGLVLNLDNCKDAAENFLQDISAREMEKDIKHPVSLFSINKFWLFVSKSQEKVLRMLDDIFIPANSQVALLTWTAVRGAKAVNNSWDLSSLFKIAREKPFMLEKIAIDVSDEDDFCHAIQRYGDPVRKRKNLQGIYLRCGIVVQYPDLMTRFDDLSMGHIDTIAKVNYPITTNLREDLNFRFDLIQVDNFGWNVNGTFDGLVGRFQNFEIEFGACGIFMRSDRLVATDFTAETVNIKASILFRQPSLSAVSNIFALPFDSAVWMSVLIFLFITSLAMLCQTWHPQNAIDMEYFDSFNFTWGAICQQGFWVSIQSHSGRILIFTTFVTSLFIFTSYSANIVALLQSPSQAIQSFEQLVASPLEIGAQDTLYNKVYFKETKEPVIKSLFDKKIKPKGEKAFMRPHMGVEKLRAGLFAYQVESHAAYHIISRTYDEHEKCGLKELEPFKLPTIAVPVRKNFPFKEIFRQRIRWQRETGLITRESRRWIKSKPTCESGAAGFVSIGLTECRYAIAMFAFGVVISIFFLLSEILFVKMKNLWSDYYTTSQSNN